MSNPNIFAYTNYRAFLRDWFAARAGRPSVRGFARRAHCSASLVSAVLNGRRGLHTGRAEIWAGVLGLTDDEQSYLLHLVTAEHDPSPEVRASADRLIEGTRALHRSRLIDDATVALFAHWYIGAVLELSRCEGWRDDPEWIAGRLRPAIARDEAEQALRTLETLGHLVRDEAGHLVSQDEVHRTEHQTADHTAVNDALFRMHRDVLGLAERALGEVPGHERQYGTLVFSLPAARLPELRARIARFQDEVISFVSGSPGSADRVYHLGVQLFPLSNADPDD